MPGRRSKAATSTAASGFNSEWLTQILTAFLCDFAVSRMQTVRTPKTPIRRHGGPTVWGASGADSGRGLPTSSPSANPVGGLEAFCLPSPRVHNDSFRSP